MFAGEVLARLVGVQGQHQARGLDGAALALQLGLQGVQGNAGVVVARHQGHCSNAVVGQGDRVKNALDQPQVCRRLNSLSIGASVCKAQVGHAPPLAGVSATQLEVGLLFAKPGRLVNQPLPKRGAHQKAHGGGGCAPAVVGALVKVMLLSKQALDLGQLKAAHHLQVGLSCGVGVLLLDRLGLLGHLKAVCP